MGDDQQGRGTLQRALHRLVQGPVVEGDKALGEESPETRATAQGGGLSHVLGAPWPTWLHTRPAPGGEAETVRAAMVQRLQHTLPCVSPHRFAGSSWLSRAGTFCAWMAVTVARDSAVCMAVLQYDLCELEALQASRVPWRQRQSNPRPNWESLQMPPASRPRGRLPADHPTDRLVRTASRCCWSFWQQPITSVSASEVCPAPVSRCGSPVYRRP